MTEIDLGQELEIEIIRASTVGGQSERLNFREGELSAVVASIQHDSIFPEDPITEAYLLDHSGARRVSVVSR